MFMKIAVEWCNVNWFVQSVRKGNIMLYVITGGSGSGKSEFAENIAVEIHKNSFERGKLYYCASMMPCDDECEARIEKHRKMRKGKGFDTVECYCNIGSVNCNDNDVVLIECMSNLAANEMYSENGSIKGSGDICAMADKVIVKGVEDIVKKAGAVVVVTNEVFSDVCSDSESLKYLSVLAYINRSLVKKASKAYEVVCGIPVEIKK